jgi:hypothetical protein
MTAQCSASLNENVPSTPRAVAAQVEIESKIRKQFIIFWFQSLRSGRIQREFHRVNLRHPTVLVAPVLYDAPACIRTSPPCRRVIEKTHSNRYRT